MTGALNVVTTTSIILICEKPANPGSPEMGLIKCTSAGGLPRMTRVQLL